MLCDSAEKLCACLLVSAIVSVLFSLFYVCLTGWSVWHSKTFSLLTARTSSYDHYYLP